MQEKRQLSGDHTDAKDAAELLSKTYLLLAHGFMEQQRFDACEVAATKAAEAVSSPAAVYLLFTCALRQGKTAEVKTHIFSLISRHDIGHNLRLTLEALGKAADAGHDVEPSCEILLNNPMLGVRTQAILTTTSFPGRSLTDCLW